MSRRARVATSAEAFRSYGFTVTTASTATEGLKFFLIYGVK